MLGQPQWQGSHWQWRSGKSVTTFGFHKSESSPENSGGPYFAKGLGISTGCPKHKIKNLFVGKKRGSLGRCERCSSMLVVTFPIFYLKSNHKNHLIYVYSIQKHIYSFYSTSAKDNLCPLVIKNFIKGKLNYFKRRWTFA